MIVESLGFILFVTLCISIVALAVGLFSLGAHGVLSIIARCAAWMHGMPLTREKHSRPWK